MGILAKYLSENKKIRKKKMNIWLVKTGEPIPSDSENVRLMRMGILANHLVQEGHNVIWWNADFNHSSKTFRQLENNTLQVNANLRINLIESSGYKKNVSLKRLLIDHTQLATNFNKATITEKKPDIILASFPTIGLSKACVQYGLKHNIPVIVDLRDLWPDAFLDPFPKFASRMLKGLLYPMYAKTKYVLSNATGLVAISEPFLEWGLETAKRKQTNFDSVFPFGYNKIDIDPKKINLTEFSFMNSDKKRKSFTFCYIGNLSYNLNMKIVAQGLQLLEDSDIDFQFVICGRGVAQKDFEILFQNNKNVHFTGFINAAQIASVMKYCDVGIVPYVDTPNFQKTISNKVVEYMAGELPIVTSIEGYMGPYLRKNNAGVVYKSPEELATQLKKLATDAQNLRAMKKSAFNLYEKNFKADYVYKQFVNHLVKVMDSHKKNKTLH